MLSITVNKGIPIKIVERLFTDFTNSATYRSKKSLDKWFKYAKCMIMGLSIRKSRKRSKEIKKRGISKNQICVAIALDRQGNLIIELLCKVRMTHKELERLYKEHIGEDSPKSYIQFATDFNNELKECYNKNNCTIII